MEIKLTGIKIKEMIQEAYESGYDGSMDLIDEEIDRIMKKYLIEPTTPIENSHESTKQYYSDSEFIGKRSEVIIGRRSKSSSVASYLPYLPDRVAKTTHKRTNKKEPNSGA